MVQNKRCREPGLCCVVVCSALTIGVNPVLVQSIILYYVHEKTVECSIGVSLVQSLIGVASHCIRDT